MQQEFFLLDQIPSDDDDRELILSQRWLSEAVKRSVVVEFGGTCGVGSIIGKTVVVSSVFAELFDKTHSIEPLLRPTIHQFFPDEVVSPIQKSWYSSDLKLCLVIPQHRPQAQKSVECRPKLDEYLILVNAISDPRVLCLKKCGRESVEYFSKRLSLIKIDVETGIPASFIYRLNGDVAGVAIASTRDDKVLALPIYELMCLYYGQLSSLREMNAI